jgi:hypothetical protein
MSRKHFWSPEHIPVAALGVVIETNKMTFSSLRTQNLKGRIHINKELRCRGLELGAFSTFILKALKRCQEG